MPTAPKRYAESLRDVVASYVHGIDVPKVDERAIVARRGAFAIVEGRFARPLRTVAFAAAAALAIFLGLDSSAVVAGMQRAFAAFALVGERTVPMSVRDVDLAKARADVPFEIIVPPSFPGITTTLREIRSSATPESASVVFNLDTRRREPEISIVETRDGGGPRQLYFTAREPDRGDVEIAPFRALPTRTDGADAKISLVGRVGKGSFVPLTWVTRGTRIVLLSPPGVLSAVQIRAIRSAMSN